MNLDPNVLYNLRILQENLGNPNSLPFSYTQMNLEGINNKGSNNMSQDLQGGLTALGKIYGDSLTALAQNNATKNVDTPLQDAISGNTWGDIINSGRAMSQAAESINEKVPNYSNIQDNATLLNTWNTNNIQENIQEPTVGNALANTMGAVAQDAATGLSVGGPWGALAGAVVGLGRGIGSSIQHSQNAKSINSMISNANLKNINNFKEQSMNNLYKAQRDYLKNTYAEGGQMNNGITMFDAGGSHETNSYGGVPQGIAEDGEPNLVEEGEVKYNDYIFSDRLKANKSLLNQYNLPTKYAGKSFAYIADKLQKESEERPNDPISKKGLDIYMNALQTAQEQIREQKAQEEQARMFDNMSLEEKANAMNVMNQQMQQEQDVQAQQMYNQQIPEQLGEYEDQQYMNIGEGSPMAFGGHMYEYGNPLNTILSDSPYLDKQRNPNNKYLYINDPYAGKIMVKNSKYTERPIGQSTLNMVSNYPYAYPYALSFNNQINQLPAVTPVKTPVKNTTSNNNVSPVVPSPIIRTPLTPEEKSSLVNIPVKTTPGYSDRFLPDSIVQDIQDEREPDKNYLEDRSLNAYWNNLMRKAPLIAGGVQTITDYLGFTNRPDYDYANDLDRLATMYNPQSAGSLGNYRKLEMYDPRVEESNLLATQAAQQRIARENSNRATANAINSNISSIFNDNYNKAMLQASQINEARKQATDQYNLNIDNINLQNQQRYDQMNNQILAQKAAMLAQAAQARDNASTMSSQIKAQNRNAFLTNLNTRGKEAYFESALKQAIKDGVVKTSEDYNKFINDFNRGLF